MAGFSFNVPMMLKVTTENLHLSHEGTTLTPNVEVQSASDKSSSRLSALSLG